MQTLYAPVKRNARAKKWEWVGREVGGRVWGTLGIALEMSLRKIRNKKKRKKEKKKALLLTSHEEDPEPGKCRCLYSPQCDVSAPDVT